MGNLKIPALPQEFDVMITDSEAPGSPQYEEMVTDVTTFTPKEELMIPDDDLNDSGSQILGPPGSPLLDHDDETETEPAGLAEDIDIDLDLDHDIDDDDDDLYRPVNGCPEWEYRTRGSSRSNRSSRGRADRDRHRDRRAQQNRN